MGLHPAKSEIVSVRKFRHSSIFEDVKLCSAAKCEKRIKKGDFYYVIVLRNRKGIQEKIFCEEHGDSFCKRNNVEAS